MTDRFPGNLIAFRLMLVNSRSREIIVERSRLFAWSSTDDPCDTCRSSVPHKLDVCGQVFDLRRLGWFETNENVSNQLLICGDHLAMAQIASNPLGVNDLVAS